MPARKKALVLLLPLLLLTGACKKEEPPPPPGDLAGPTAVAAVGDRVFVTSPVDDGLRVMMAAGSVASEGCSEDSDCGGGQYCEANQCIRAVEEVLRAPDPLFSLIIPALRAPGRLLSLPGAAGERSLLVVSSETDAQLRFIDADVEALLPLGLPVPLAGRAVALASSEVTGEIYALLDGPELGGGVTAPSAVARLAPEAGLRTPGETFGRAPAVVADLWPLPLRGLDLAVSEAGGETTLWGASAEGAELVQLFPADGRQQRLSIPGELALLRASPPASFDPGFATAGERLFGLTADGRSLLFFEGGSGAVVAELSSGGQVFPVPIAGTVSDLTVAADVSLTLPRKTAEEEGEVVELPWLLVLSMVNGDALLVDGLSGRTIDADGDQSVTPVVQALRPGADDSSAPRIVEIDNPDHDPANPSSAARIPNITLTAGVTRSRNWTLAWRGLVPAQNGLLGLLRESGAAVELVPTDPSVDLLADARVGDQVEILTQLEVPEGCTSLTGRLFLVDTVAADALGLRPKGSASLPDAACVLSPLRYRIRSAEFLITASGLSETFRASPGETFTYAGEPYLATAPAGPAFAVELEAGQSDLEDGATRLIEVLGGADPWRIDPGNILGSTARFPGTPAVFAGREGAPESARAYLPFPGSHAVFAFDLFTGAGKTAIR
ncbi:MAG: hypothetical protein P1V51_06610 [Deltaproteobacteria bacterium]|nr:hypothetical protein [Deltaproteobacteria bacterium]